MEEVIGLANVDQMEGARAGPLHEVLEFFRGDFHGRGGQVRPQYRTSTGVPTLTLWKKVSAMSWGMRTQPWLAA